MIGKWSAMKCELASSRKLQQAGRRYLVNRVKLRITSVWDFVL
ncbi:hypothetical protein GALL_44220 [mine drainage metagenome]|uniref:Uncharacterized protein n=1 Tax=mine drainage metagenome TaxID=410659 RepID=A0A1J5T187_9ZZZZ